MEWKTCYFCRTETIQHVLFDDYAQLRDVYLVLGILLASLNTEHSFSSWQKMLKI